MKVHFSSASDNWETPQFIFDELNEEFGPFDLDVCATVENRKCTNYFSNTGIVGTDGLLTEWYKGNWPEKFWMNPPYGREIGKWVKKAYEESQKGCRVVCLLPSRTDTKWFHDYCMKGRIRFLKGRLKFGDAKNSAPFPSMVVVFDKYKLGQI